MTVCLFGAGSAEYIDLPLAGKNTRIRVEEFVHSLPDVQRVVVFASENPTQWPSDWTVTIKPDWTVALLLRAIAAEVSGPDQSILFTYADQPFTNQELARRLIERHERYRADYTFADGYPVGLAPEIVAGRALSHLVELSSEMDGPVGRDAIFSVVQKDINRLDVETELSRVDQRLLRLTLAVDNMANTVVCQRLAGGGPEETGAPEAIDEWPDHVDGLAAFHRSLPRFVSVQILEQEVQELDYSPYLKMRDDVRAPGAVMSLDQFSTIVSGVSAMAPEAVISISHWGEAALHPHVIALVELVLGHPALQLIVETSGVGWQREDRDRLLAIKDDRLSIIIGLDTNDPAVYERIRGSGFKEAVAFAEAAIEAKSKEVHVQAVRYDATEATLNDFYNHWKRHTENIIIQKYDWFCGELPQRKIGDLTPLHRFPCWHLQRDLVILVDGSVPLCREDIAQKNQLGGVFKRGLEAAWDAGTRIYADHLVESYPEICRSCDEFYTFNF